MMRHLICATVLSLAVLGGLMPSATIAEWSVGEPIVGYWEGPGSLLSGKEAYGVLDDASAKPLVAAGFNLACAATIPEVQLAHAYGLRVLLQSALLSPDSLDGGPKQTQLNALIDQYKVLPAAYGYHITDEPNASQFADLGKIVAYLRQRDPEHLAYINLLPNNATDEQLGTNGYDAHLSQFIGKARPSLLSYDHYQFFKTVDAPGYLANLESVAQAAKRARVPFLNTVQACSYAPVMRVPNADETRFLVYTTLAYGAQGISYYHYASWGPEYGGIMLPDGKPLPLFATLQTLNREFVAVAKQYQAMHWLGTYVKGYAADAAPPGTRVLPEGGLPLGVGDVPAIAYSNGAPLKGLLLGFFGKGGDSVADATLALVQNLDYSASRACRATASQSLSVFDAATGRWKSQERNEVDLTLPPGGGVLVRIDAP